jgi:hypothetical protein
MTEAAAYLERIERYSSWMVSDAETVLRNVRTVAAVPDFQTNANVTMKAAKARLEESLASINEAIEAFAAKPRIERKAA